MMTEWTIWLNMRVRNILEILGQRSKRYNDCLMYVMKREGSKITAKFSAWQNTVISLMGK